MFFIEYTEHNQRKALNLAMCQTIETHVYETSSKSEFALYIHHEKFGKKVIEFESKEELFSYFDTLIDAIKSYQGHWMSQHPLRHDINRS